MTHTDISRHLAKLLTGAFLVMVFGMTHVAGVSAQAVRPGHAPAFHRVAPPLQKAPSRPSPKPVSPVLPSSEPLAQTKGKATPPPTSTQPLVTPNRPGQTQQHLAGWMETHRNLPLAEQQRALENEPGFHSLPALDQERMHARLSQLNGMNPVQREKMLERTEAMERLAPPQRQQVRAAMAQVGSLPEDRRHAVSRTFYQVRDMPPAQRQTYLNSPQFHAQFNDQERTAIHGLLDISPIYAPLQAEPQPH
jgi:hypothetical protein